jgi:hypothetical protein
MNADLETIGGRPALRLERYLAHPVERVWRAVSDPAEVRRWMPAAADWTLTVGASTPPGKPPGQAASQASPDLEARDSLGRLSLHADVLHDGEPGAVPRPFEHALNVLGGPLEDRLDAAVGAVPHPAAHPVPLGRPPAGVAEGHPLHLT